MLAGIILSVAVPALIFSAHWVLRKRHPNLVADVRGIALQTVIIIVVLLAIGGGVAGVLLSRGGAAINNVKDQPVKVEASRYKDQFSCEAATHTWSSSSCT